MVNPSRLHKSKKKLDYFAHESAYIDKGAKIGKGAKIWHFSHISSGAKIGRDCRMGQNVYIGSDVVIGNNVKIQNNVSIYTGVTLEDDVFCGPSCVFTNVFNPRGAVPRMNEIRSTLIKKGATIGANATIICGNNIGRFAFIGASAVVTKDIPDYALVYGSPAHIQGWMCECGEKLLFRRSKAGCSKCNKRYRKKANLIFQAKGNTSKIGFFGN